MQSAFFVLLENKTHFSLSAPTLAPKIHCNRAHHTVDITEHLLVLHCVHNVHIQSDSVPTGYCNVDSFIMGPRQVSWLLGNCCCY
jgi:hypothetical protein